MWQKMSRVWNNCFAKRTPCRFVETVLELAEKRPGRNLPSLDPYDESLRGTHHIQTVIQSAGIQRQRGAAGRGRRGVGTGHDFSGGERPRSVHVNFPGGNIASAIGAEFARDDLSGASRGS